MSETNQQQSHSVQGNLEQLASLSIPKQVFYISKKPMFISLLFGALLAIFILYIGGDIVKTTATYETINVKKLIGNLILVAFIAFVFISNIFMLYLSFKPMLTINEHGFQFMNNKKMIPWADLDDIHCAFERRSMFNFGKFTFYLKDDSAPVENRFNYSRSKFNAADKSFFQFLREIKGINHQDLADLMVEYWHIAQAKQHVNKGN